MMEHNTGMRVRFAPSPTGYLHVGGARTALYNWLLARRAGGVFVLRIEDTDRARSSDEHTQAILSGMQWLGLDWDEGPFHQADGLERHIADARRLLEVGRAYRCFCTAEDLEARRKHAAEHNLSQQYDRRCLAIDPGEATRRAEQGEPHTIRFHVPEGTTWWEDAVHGRVEFDNKDVEDFIVLRTDGTPIYNMAVVSDDIEMRITHVIRGDDHISNTPKQILLYRALGAPEPVFGHVPMILGPDGKRLSKRHGAVSVMAFRDEGILPEALLNYLVRLGWSHGDEEIFSVDRMIELFDIKNVNNSAAVFDYDKLLWLNQHYIKESSAERIAHHLRGHLGRLGIDPVEGPEVLDVVGVQRERAKTLKEMAEISAFFYRDFDAYDEQAANKHLKPEAAAPLARLRTALAELRDWRPEPLHQTVIDCAESLGLKLGKVAQPLRVALCGRAASPGIDVTLHLLGRDATLRRIDRALAWIEQGTGSADA